MSKQLTPLEDACVGAVSGMFSLACVYPLDIIKTRLQVQSSSLEQYTSLLDGVKKIIQTEGITGLYTGLPAALASSTSTNFAYFYWYNIFRNGYRRAHGYIISAPMEFIIGAAAGAMAQLCTMPVTIAVTRQQTSLKEDRRSLWETMLAIVDEDGWKGLWKGLGPALVLVVNPAITYGCTERLKHAWKTSRKKEGLSGLEMFVIGAIAKTIATFVTYPYIIAKVRMQWKPSKRLLDGNSEAVKMYQYRDAWDVMRKVIAVDGIFGLYRGIRAHLWKTVLSQALLMMTMEELKVYVITMLKVSRIAARGGKRHR